jgi:hypothetical protein
MRSGGTATKLRLDQTAYHGWTQLLYGTNEPTASLERRRLYNMKILI